jgi:hypothetical protein
MIITSPFSTPSIPIGPLNISEVQKGLGKADGSLRLSWHPPEDTGGLPVTRYIVQMRYANTPAWHRVGVGRRQVSTEKPPEQFNEEDMIPTTSLVTGLMQGQRCVFRVAAINEVGTGAFLESDEFEMPEDESKLNMFTYSHLPLFKSSSPFCYV